MIICEYYACLNYSYLHDPECLCGFKYFHRIIDDFKVNLVVHIIIKSL